MCCTRSSFGNRTICHLFRGKTATIGGVVCEGEGEGELLINQCYRAKELTCLGVNYLLLVYLPSPLLLPPLCSLAL